MQNRLSTVMATVTPSASGTINPSQNLTRTTDVEARLAAWNTDTLCEDVRILLGLSRRQAFEVVELYEQFWGLMARYPQTRLVPPMIVDRVWHLHILDTRRYRQDCWFLVGEFVDHQPRRSQPLDEGMGLDLTMALFEQHFGVEVRSKLQDWQDVLKSQTHSVSPRSAMFDPTEGGECYRLC
ncbi:glycine-rich domain-containing protein [Baaleninema sp.]|uniref:glycine-rich domain-containing protein n=1 Tax=Baaleninema sp. TaxID=3101197 RepID=UPI003D073EEC